MSPLKRIDKTQPPAKALQSKSPKRRFLTFRRVLGYGVSNLTRNAWLTVAATAIMTITLIIIFMTVAARTVLVDTASQVRDRIDVSIYLRTDTTEKQVDQVEMAIKKLKSVKSVNRTSPTEAKKEFVNQHINDKEIIEALNDADNMFPWTIRVKVANINDTSELQSLVKNDSQIKQVIDPDNAPSFESDKAQAASVIGKWVRYAEKFGIGATILFTAVSILIVFNTIRMAIFSRKDEIHMMKLIGADKSFIRGPFIVEAVFYGVIAAIIAMITGIGILFAAKDGLESNGIEVGSVMGFVTNYALVTLIALMAIGALIGTISSLLATRRYLNT